MLSVLSLDPLCCAAFDGSVFAAPAIHAAAAVADPAVLLVSIGTPFAAAGLEMVEMV